MNNARNGMIKIKTINLPINPGHLLKKSRIRIELFRKDSAKSILLSTKFSILTVADIIVAQVMIEYKCTKL